MNSKKLPIILLSIFTLCGCEKINQSIDKPSTNNRIKAEEIFAYNEFDIDNEKTITVEELNLSFVLKGPQVYEKETGKMLGQFWSFYLADVNKDGYRDLCYTSCKGSGAMSWYAEIFDVYHNEIIFTRHERGKFDYNFAKKGDYLYLNQHQPSSSLLSNVVCGGGYVTFDLEKGIDIEWDNVYEISDLEVNFYQADNVSKKLEPIDNCITVNKNQLFMLETKVIGGKDLPDNYLIRNSDNIATLKIFSDCNNHIYRQLCLFKEAGNFDLEIDFSGIKKHIKFNVINENNTKTITDYISWCKDINIGVLQAFEYHYWSQASDYLYGEGIVSADRYEDGKSLLEAYDFLSTYVYEVCPEIHDMLVEDDVFSNYKYIYTTEDNEYSFETRDSGFLEIGGKYYLLNRILSMGYSGGYIFGFRFASDHNEFDVTNLENGSTTKINYLKDFIFYYSRDEQAVDVPDNPKFVIDFSQKIYVYTPKIFKTESDERLMYIKFGTDFSSLFDK